MKLLMHSKNDVPVSARDMELMRCPVEATRSYQPMRHYEVVATCTEALDRWGFTLDAPEFVLSKDGMRMFGAAFISAPGMHTDGWRPVIGLRNSYDKTLPAGMVLGSQVTVCSNLAFSGDLGEVRRRHVGSIHKHFPAMVETKMNMLRDQFTRMNSQYNSWRNAHIPSTQMLDHILVRLFTDGVVGSSRLGKVIEQIYAPDHLEFRGRTLWTVFNAVTESMKGLTPFRVSQETHKLHTYIDYYYASCFDLSARKPA